jgi:hypothetical protein
MYSESSVYVSLWSKYRPMILQLMVAADKEPQQYKLSSHEFKALGQKEKTGYAFLLEAYNGKAQNKISGSMVARDLLQVLQQSQKASQLMREATYQLSMDKQFVFHVTKKVEAIEEVS